MLTVIIVLCLNQAEICVGDTWVTLDTCPSSLLLSRLRGLSLALSMWAGLQAAPESQRQSCTYWHILLLAILTLTPTLSHLKINLQIIKMCHLRG